MEQRKSIGSVLLRIGRANSMKIELFHADSWPTRPGARTGNFRLRVNGRWHGEGKYVFFHLAEVAALVLRWLGELVGHPAGGDAEAPPELPRGTRVRVATQVEPRWSQTRGLPKWESGWTLTEPIKAWDGRWYVTVHTCAAGDFMAPVADLERMA